MNGIRDLPKMVEVATPVRTPVREPLYNPDEVHQPKVWCPEQKRRAGVEGI